MYNVDNKELLNSCLLGSINWGFLGSVVRELLSTYTQFASQCRFNIVNGTFSIWPFPQYGDWLLTEDNFPVFQEATLRLCYFAASI